MEEGKQNQSSADPLRVQSINPPKDQIQEEMGWIEHLDELRIRIFNCILAWVIATIGAYFFADDILGFLKKPLMDVLPADQQNLFFTNLFENFLVPIKISAYTGLFISAPVFLYQLWLFVSPGLYKKEKKVVIPFILAGSIFFFLGSAFGYFVVFPAAFDFLINYNSGSGNVPIITLHEYFGTALKLLLAFGVCFELPVILVLLGFLGIVPSAYLKKNRGVAFLVISILCAFFSPPDLLSMFFLLVPIYFLFELAIVIIGLFEKARSKS